MRKDFYPLTENHCVINHLLLNKCTCTDYNENFILFFAIVWSELLHFRYGTFPTHNSVSLTIFIHSFHLFHSNKDNRNIFWRTFYYNNYHRWLDKTKSIIKTPNIECKWERIHWCNEEFTFCTYIGSLRLYCNVSNDNKNNKNNKAARRYSFMWTFW